ncbi:C40 family peptidase [Streptomyces sp. NPDC059918]|uniref:C40 family peptidase n=1 Tax=unclassified Streptomyces TaxID=2593676 RepID=UPI00364B94EE
MNRPRTAVVNLGIATGILGTTIAATPAVAAEQDRLTAADTLSIPVGFVGDADPDAGDTADHILATAFSLELRGEEDRAASDASGRARSSKAAAQQQADEAKAASDRAAAEERTARKAAAGSGTPKSGTTPSGGQRANTPAPSSGVAGAAVAFARSKIGYAYVMGATSGGAYDCSGLVQSAYRAAGISLPRTSQAQSGAYADVTGQWRPGDILYWGPKGAATHVAIYVGDGMFVGAQNSRTGVVMQKVYGKPKAVRPA